MQLLFDGSDEGAGEGLGVIPGQVTRLRAVRVPQIGWNEVEPVRDPGRGDPLFTAAPLAMVYYANSYVCRPVDERVVTAWTEHEGDRFPAAVRAGRAVGVQFHPEKSSSEGVRFLRTFLDLARQTESAR
jgi:glutamine amidotransferase